MGRQARLSRFVGERGRAEAEVTQERDRLRAAARSLKSCLTARNLLQKAAQAVQREAHGRVSAVVTRCLEAVFEGEGYAFALLFERKRGRTECRAVIRQGEVEVSPMDAASGAAVDVTSFALRLAALIASTPPPRRLLCLDEPFKHVSEANTPRLKGLIEGLAKDLKVQFLISTHNRGLRAGRVVEL